MGYKLHGLSREDQFSSLTFLLCRLFQSESEDKKKQSFG